MSCCISHVSKSAKEIGSIDVSKRVELLKRAENVESSRRARILGSSRPQTGPNELTPGLGGMAAAAE
jgi:hypothetical protein